MAKITSYVEANLFNQQYGYVVDTDRVTRVHIDCAQYAFDGRAILVVDFGFDPDPSIVGDTGLTASGYEFVEGSLVVDLRDMTHEVFPTRHDGTGYDGVLVEDLKNLSVTSIPKVG